MVRPPKLVRARSSGVEHLTFNQRAMGSNPIGLTIFPEINPGITQAHRAKDAAGFACAGEALDNKKAGTATRPGFVINSGQTISSWKVPPRMLR